MDAHVFVAFWVVLGHFLVLLLGAKLRHVIATLALESAGITSYFTEARLKPRDELFWFKKPQLLLRLIHFILFQVCCTVSLQLQLVTQEFDHQEFDSPRAGTPPAKHLELELQTPGVMTRGAPRLRPSASALSSPLPTFPQEPVTRSY
ncbi:Mlo-related protein [Artemisia annua]|uniref:Mlo-related protein n=1 Tax=Artemisia annua TaxID=35608 RepID=A0A2U1KBP5_ARTAN|nr:Mlo-related protein [Artemisia annua]